MNPFDEIARTSPELIDTLYQQYLNDPNSVDATWAAIFAGYDFANQPREFKKTVDHDYQTNSVSHLIHTYRDLGHMIANLDPLGTSSREHPLLDLSEFGFTESDLAQELESCAFGGTPQSTLDDLISALRDTYCHTIGVEFIGVRDKEQRQWLQEQMEPCHNRPGLDAEQQQVLLKRLIQAESFEQFIHKKYVGAKRFSLEGAEVLVPLLDAITEVVSIGGAKELVIGMPHRGRLNVLTHLLRKPYTRMLAEFEGVFFPADMLGAGDVKYHLGYSHDHVTNSGNKLHLSLCYNPSHLEIINPIVQGMVRAKQDASQDQERRQVVPVLLHGDAAFAGQGIVYETLMFSDIDGYSTGGTIHIIVNNQIGFTTNPDEYRSTPYASDLAKVIQAPVFHVNADDPEAVVQVACLAAGFRQRFCKDVFIDLICYRRYGHNELDDPTYTQPQVYSKIKQHPTITSSYGQKLVTDGVLSTSEIDNMQNEIQTELDKAYQDAKTYQPNTEMQAFGGLWAGLSAEATDWTAITRINPETITKITQALIKIPEEFTPHKRITTFLQQLEKMYTKGQSLNWAAGELLTYGSLLLEGIPVRLSGQDSARGTFSHRHAVLHDANDNNHYIPLNHISSEQASFEVLNSPLNEAGVLGFEYGFASVNPKQLIIWEAQFGDFANGAQVVVDQFIASSESKWRRGNGIVLLLPHGCEGQGPEHSSARPERYLQLCAEQNMQVVNCTTPAQFFHVLRRQVKRQFRKPLIVLSPKSLLRHPQAISSLDDFTQSDFQNVIDDIEITDKRRVKRIVLCSGKIYYALQRYREAAGRDDVALIRLEQMYPFPTEELMALCASYEAAEDVCWVQEEPRNQGAWHFVAERLASLLGETQILRYIGRPESASPASGNYNVHKKEEEDLLRSAFLMSEQRPARLSPWGMAKVLE
ncbi:2-oxoglutarate dehydrogenase E1 component-like [Ylistrum balloti]|uniref:2-oxoglutarate dehydrogenase E1 component-like n=1 Tax=Ylistrum balloti TaxID=509963 RepID=UPI002905A849|nr:2-oxoglutarate dehydrogenase E1 component-like [Ylistrum balloti]